MAAITGADRGEPGSIAVAGRRLEVAWWGRLPGEAPTLVLLHEGLGCVALWRGFPAALAAATGLGVFAYSRFGYGQSDTVSLPRPLRYMHEEADLLPAVLDAAGIGDCMLVGHSDGASIAAIHAGSPEADPRIRRIALIAPHFFVEDVTVASIAAIRAEYEQGDLRARLARHHRDVDAAFHGWNGAWLDPGFRAWDITAYLRRIRLPILVVQGSDDPYGTEAQPRAAERLAAGPVSIVMVAHAGHAPHVEAAQSTCDAVAGFARSLHS